MKRQFLYYILLLPIAAYANVVTWNGVLPDNITYTDTNVNITGDTMLGQGTTTVVASNTDITIYVSHRSKIYSNDASQSTLILQAMAPYSITIIVNATLEFVGMANELYTPIIIEERGTGSIIWIVEEDKKLIFGSRDNQGGTLLKIVYDNGQMPEHIFKPRLHHEQIRFERHCRLGYKQLSISAPVLTVYGTVDALNSSDNHYGYIQFSDGATIKYERTLLVP